ncbi:hypothetical protein [Chitinophaga filiformis]|uniref:Uncharacterized protein n=1 Tax=Chitinophaga filiformis TaxID=104663 RepID=A0ABY4IDF9_CHIFI|nr:hypothetical protein [Chitinophaga filiformis]UPK72866.1 hypothetical protein MYF79_16365 [Chitinophaga filiformis]
MKYTVIIFFTLSVLMNIGCSYDGNVQTTVTQLPKKEGDSAVYIKKTTWGFSGDERTVVISNNPAEELSPEPSSEYVYEGLFTMFYKTVQDTLYVYTPIVVTVPKRFKSIYVVVQKQLSNPEMMELLDSGNYKKLNLVEL